MNERNTYKGVRVNIVHSNINPSYDPVTQTILLPVDILNWRFLLDEVLKHEYKHYKLGKNYLGHLKHDLKNNLEIFLNKSQYAKDWDRFKREQNRKYLKGAFWIYVVNAVLNVTMLFTAIPVLLYKAYDKLIKKNEGGFKNVRK